MKVIQVSHRNNRRAEGFSLAELMVVIVILGLLATLVVPNVMKQLFTANDAVAKNDISAISQAITNYAIEHAGKYPERLEELITADENGHKYLDRNSLPKDPWKNEYQYEPPQAGQPFKVICYGRDGQPGGEGEDSDIDNVTMLEKSK
ncbi:MAG: type II secretion system major pseudopilin GspG [Planctomycetes bacterium]|nr:type II secretion system major pseudopilin GspG [Planctomycetota bacterium]